VANSPYRSLRRNPVLNLPRASYGFSHMKRFSDSARSLLVILLGLASASIPASEPRAAAPSHSHAASSSATRDLLIQAIGERRVLTFVYRGHARTVEPHACGVTAKGEAVLHGYQTAGGSASRPPPGWRTFAIGEIRDVALGAETFPGARDGYSANELRLDPLWAELPAAETGD